MLMNAVSFAVPHVRHGREIVLLAEHEAVEHGYGFVDAEHLLAAAVLLCNGMPRFRSVLESHGVTVDAVRAELRVFVGAGRSDLDEAERVICTPAAMRIVARAQYHAGPGVAIVRPHHVLLAVLDAADDPLMGGAAELLSRIGVDERRFRRALRRAARRG